MDDPIYLYSEDFTQNASNLLKQTWIDKNFTDVTLATGDDKVIHVHKAVLSFCSPFFSHILTNNSHQNLLIYLKDIKYSELNLIMQFIYLGECNVMKSDLDDFLAAAHSLKIKGLTNMIDPKNIEEKQLTNLIENKTTNIKKEHNSYPLQNVSHKETVIGKDVGHHHQDINYIQENMEQSKTKIKCQLYNKLVSNKKIEKHMQDIHKRKNTNKHVSYDIYNKETYQNAPIKR